MQKAELSFPDTSVTWATCQQPWSTPPCSCRSLWPVSLGLFTFELFAYEVPKRAENFPTLSTVEKNFACQDSCFHEIIAGFMCQGGDFMHHHGADSKSIRRHLVMRTASLDIEVLASCPWQTLVPVQLALRSLSALPRPVGGWWQACGLWQGERGHDYCVSHRVLWILEWQGQHL